MHPRTKQATSLFFESFSLLLLFIDYSRHYLIVLLERKEQKVCERENIFIFSLVEGIYFTRDRMKTIQLEVRVLRASLMSIRLKYFLVLERIKKESDPLLLTIFPRSLSLSRARRVKHFIRGRISCTMHWCSDDGRGVLRERRRRRRRRLIESVRRRRDARAREGEKSICFASRYLLSMNYSWVFSLHR